MKKFLNISNFLTGMIATLVLGVAQAQDIPGSVQCNDLKMNPFTIKPKTITIRNNSNDGTVIYPVVTVAKSDDNQWIKACFRTDTVYKTELYKIYINETNGLAPNQEVTLTLPVLTRGGLEGDQFISWWNGGRIILANKKDDLDTIRSQEKPMGSIPEGLQCEGDSGTHCNMAIYAAKTEFPANISAQLTEFTFGAVNPPKGEKFLLMDPTNVGYNISYVDHVYLPVAMGPKGNRYIGYTGSTMHLAEFRQKMREFLAPGNIGDGWPVYNSTDLKLPGGYNVFAQRYGTLVKRPGIPVVPEHDNPPVLTLLKCVEGHCTDKEKRLEHFGKSVQDMQNLWAACMQPDHFYDSLSNHDVNQPMIDCPADMKENFQKIHKFFMDNYENYKKVVFPSGVCTKGPNKKPILNDPMQMLLHIYGWVPFNEGCGADANALAGAPGSAQDKRHAVIQPIYIDKLQYNFVKHPDAPLFNPYVKLIHDYLGMNSYAFSVDDAVGFMSEVGDGVIVTVGGGKGLENEEAFDYKKGFVVQIGTPKPLDGTRKPLLRSYGVCYYNENPADPDCKKVIQDIDLPKDVQIPGFRIGTIKEYPFKIAFTDMNGNVYTFKVMGDFSELFKKDRKTIIDHATCEVRDPDNNLHPNSQKWCNTDNPNQQKEEQLTKNYLSFGDPADYLK